MIVLLYRFIGWYRLSNRKENPKRFRERFGYTVQNRPQGQLFWFHAASVGETLSVISFIETLHKLKPEITILLTTTTLASEKIVNRYLGDYVIHQFIPYDAPSFIKRFLDHWKPNHCFLVESELWPCLLYYTKKNCPISVVNARISDRSYKRWKFFLWIAQKIMSFVSHIWASSESTKKRFLTLGAKYVSVMPSLKLFANPLPYEKEKLEKLLNTRPKWLAVSTHPDEELLCAYVHQNSNINNLQTWIAPRHIDRVYTIKKQLEDLNLSVCLFSQYKNDTDVVLIDSIGELGLFFTLCSFVFVGGSFCNRGGHNPLEPLFHGCHTVWGPNMSNFKDILSFIPYDGTCETKELLIKTLKETSFFHQKPFTYQESLEYWVKKITNI